ncbi:NAD(P)H-hydrate epimerase [Desulfocicer vacuolatum DSM 3385]|uniref:Bifunctional NAD(P)H-hydrate repair enzyme n=1 Tax=Desulfocicer vacuolatum DSM 3385 TaxID=1121400 RepID=A0A1W1YIT7_9BACT|nr:NAD(P)H-hydrate dehydratase [Desulfocicer vacuolatum]SMC35658.1 NAD(P)H-hydrate epimerase [Desulfocicer vacuolatum DSM 3385]
MYLVTAGEMREMDRKTIEEFGLPGQILMENAGRKALDMLFDHFPKMMSKKIGIVVGRGNNGGDGLVMARYLLQMGKDVTTFVFTARDKIKGDALSNLILLETLCEKKEGDHLFFIPDKDTFETLQSHICMHDIFVDGLLGTGLNTPVRGFFKEVITAVNGTGCPIFSLDIPSGLDADTGMPLGTCIKATATATFGFAKAGLFLGHGREFTGKVKVMDIGIPDYIATQSPPRLQVSDTSTIAPLFPPRSPHDHKGTWGHVLIIAGSRGKSGAAVLAANAAVAAGTGLVTLGIPHDINSSVETATLEAMTAPMGNGPHGYLTLDTFDPLMALGRNKTALALGPGLGTHEETRKLVTALVKESDLPLILDADGLNCIAHDPSLLKQRKAPTILTPHPGEMARLTGLSTREIQAHRLGIATQFAKKYNVILVLKGAGTLTALPNGFVFFCPTGNPGMATGGTGDVLTGMIAGLAAQGMTPEDAARAGTFLHGACGDFLAQAKGPWGFKASDLITALPGIFSQLTKNNAQDI